MDFTLSDEQLLIRETARAFFTDQATSERTRAAMRTGGIDVDLWTCFCREVKLSGIGIPESLGGAGLGLVEMAVVAEAAGAQVAALPHLGSLALAAQAIVAGGTEAQQREWLPQLIDGSTIGAWLHDPTLEERDGRLFGRDGFVTHGGAAGLYVASGSDGAWLVQAGARGLSIRPRTTMDETRPYAEIVLAGAEAAPLADPVAAIEAARRAGIVALAAEALGGAQACLDRTVAYSLDRTQFGRQIGSFQAYKHRLADMMVEIEQARSAVYWVACTVDEDSDEAAMALHAAKAFTADTFAACAGAMIQLHGGIGFTWEHDAHLYFKRARATQTILGTPAWHREQAAKLIFGEAA